MKIATTTLARFHYLHRKETPNRLHKETTAVALISNPSHPHRQNLNQHALEVVGVEKTYPLTVLGIMTLNQDWQIWKNLKTQLAMLGTLIAPRKIL